MKGDFTRDTYRRKKHYSSVRMQQGRVQLDADWNEQLDIQMHLQRTGIRDVIGHAGGAHGTDAQGNDLAGFKIVTNGANLRIARGRYHVNGILCENEKEIPLTDQPHLPGFNLQSATKEPGIYLAYLDVWERHITALEDPEIRESALGGPDTTTRTQVIWQVKLLKVADLGRRADCDMFGPGWSPPGSESTGRLSARAQPASQTPDPCLIPTSAGYRRLENQLYRVEIHNAGELNHATFKWSRDNGSIVARWLSQVGDDKITVSSIGRDQTLSFAIGQWLELTDDTHELRGEPGILAQVINIEGNVLTFDPSTATGAPNITNFPTNPTVRRWDVTGGEITTMVSNENDGFLQLESGVEIRFQPGHYRTGDYWFIPARSADGNIEWSSLDPTTPLARSPRGIQHHFAPLALITWNTTGPEEIRDCRKIFPTLTATTSEPSKDAPCCLQVSPGDDIQAALDSLPEEGGCICLKSGLHQIGKPIHIRRSNVILTSESPGAQVYSEDLSNLLEISPADGGVISDVVVEGIRFSVSGTDQSRQKEISIFLLHHCREVRIRRCRIELTGKEMLPLVGVTVFDAADISIADNRIRRIFHGIYADDVEGLRIADNGIEAAVNQLSAGVQLSSGAFGIRVQTASPWPCSITGNSIYGFLTGVSLNDGPEGSVVEGNRISLPLFPEKIFLQILGDIDRGAVAGALGYGVEVAAGYCRIRANSIDLSMPLFGGVKGTGEHGTIADNTLKSTFSRVLAGAPELIPTGVFLESGDAVAADYSVIRNNSFTGLQHAILVAGVNNLDVVHNQITGQQQTGHAIMVKQGINTLLAENRIEQAGVGIALIDGARNRLRKNSIGNSGNGLLVYEEASVEISANSLNNVKGAGIGGLYLSASTSVASNRLSSCGFQGLALGLQGPGAGIAVHSLDDLTVEACEVIDTGISEDGNLVNASTVMGIAALSQSCRLVGNRVAYSNPTLLNPRQNYLGLMLVGPEGPSTVPIAAVVEDAVGSALVLNNTFVGSGPIHVVDFARIEQGNVLRQFEKVTFSNNFCEHLNGARNDASVTVLLWGKHLVVMGNQVKADSEIMSMDLSNRLQVALVGNVTTGGYVGADSTVPSPLSAFNVQLS